MKNLNEIKKFQVSSIVEENNGGSGEELADLLNDMSGEGSAIRSGSGAGGLGSGEDGEGSEEEEDLLEYVEIPEKYYYVYYLMRLLAAVHFAVSVAMCIAYYQLKVPII